MRPDNSAPHGAAVARTADVVLSDGGQRGRLLASEDAAEDAATGGLRVLARVLHASAL